MVKLYRRLLQLYPSIHRYRFGEEMAAVFASAENDARRSGFFAAACFYVREFQGLLSSAAAEHVRLFSAGRATLDFRNRRCPMQKSFRYPLATVTLMILTFAGVVLAIEKARRFSLLSDAMRHVSVAPLPPHTFGSFVFIWLVVCVLCLAVWGLLFALRRSPSQRFEQLQTWPLK